MKNIVLVVVAAAGVLMFAAIAHAGYALMSPKAKASEDSLKKVPGTTPDMIDRSIKPASPKVIALRESLRKAPSTGPTIDLAHGPRPTLSPKDPRYEREVRRLGDVQAAPLK